MWLCSLQDGITNSEKALWNSEHLKPYLNKGFECNFKTSYDNSIANLNAREFFDHEHFRTFLFMTSRASLFVTSTS